MRVRDAPSPPGLIRSIRFIRYIRIALIVDASNAGWTRRPEEPSQPLPDFRSPIPDSRWWYAPLSDRIPAPVSASEILSTYRQLDDAKIIETLERLRNRIRDRFPGSGLSRVSEELLEVARESASLAAYLARPNWPVRVGVGLAIAAMLGAVFVALTRIRLQGGVAEWPELVQVIESGVNDVVFLGIAVFFLLTVETRVKRQRALRALHQLRSIAHVVDMHQLTKDPEQLDAESPANAASPARTMTRGELGRYLDYCTELLSVTSKIAALYVERFNDDVTLGAVNEIESLTAGLSRKIWQKISMLNA